MKFYNAGGSLGLNKPNSYFEGKDVSLNQLKQYQLVNHKTIEVAQQPKQENKVEIEHFRAIKDDYGRWAFYIKPKNEPQFSVYPPKEHMNKYFSVRNTPDEKTTRAALANKWYEVAKQFPDVRVDIINPHPAKDIDMSRIVNPTITKSAQDPKVKLVLPPSMENVTMHLSTKRSGKECGLLIIWQNTRRLLQPLFLSLSSEKAWRVSRHKARL